MADLDAIAQKYGSQAEKHSIWRVFKKGLHHNIQQPLLASAALKASFDAYAEDRDNEELQIAFLEAVVRATGNVAGQLLAKEFRKETTVDVDDDKISLFKLAKTETVEGIAAELAVDPEFVEDLAEDDFDDLIEEISRKVGRGLGTEFGFDKAVQHVLSLLKKLLNLPV
jgi:hypothetical protein